MDVGADNFRFTLDDPEKRARTIRHPKTAELHLDSLDRYTTGDLLALSSGSTAIGKYPQNVAKLYGSIFGNPSTDNATTNCTIKTRGNMLYGYLSRVALTQFSLSYKVPTVVTGYNDLLSVITVTTGTQTVTEVTLPQGYYTVATLGVALQTALRTIAGLGALTVTPPDTQSADVGASVVTGYAIATGSATTMAFGINEPVSVTVDNSQRLGRTYRLIGANKASFGYASETLIPTYPPGFIGTGAVPTLPTTAFTMGIPNFRPTDYVDIVSNALTNYKDTKDGNSSDAGVRPIGRIWLTEYPLASQTSQYAWPQDGMWGMSPMTFTKTWANPNWSQWSPNQAVFSVDITLLDMWGNPLFWSSTYNTEWSATLSVTE